jgi:nucleotide-binding universal stress UspA family protein
MTLLTDEQSTGAVPFARALAGVDGSDAGLQAAFQAGRLVAPEREAARYGATLIAVGSHEHSRMSGMSIGGVAGHLLPNAPCSVLIARPAISEALFPASLTVSVDGSPGSLEAVAVAEHLSARFDAALRIVLAWHGDVDVVPAELRAPQLEIVDGSAVDVLVDASATADLLIVGSRGLHGPGALGSGSERVAHRAHSSVLVVRREPQPYDARTSR